MTAQDLMALGATWAVISDNEFDEKYHTTILWVWVKEILE